MPPRPGKIRSIQRRIDAANNRLTNAIDKPKRKPTKPIDPNAWKKQHYTDSGVPKTLVIRHDSKKKSKFL